MKPSQQHNFMYNMMNALQGKYMNDASMIPKRIQSLQTFSMLIALFSACMIPAILVKIVLANQGSANHIRLIISNHGIDLLPLYSKNLFGFICLCTYEMIKFGLISYTFYNLYLFLKSLNMTNPFKYIVSKNYISVVALFSGIFFVVDAIGAFHLNYYQSALGIAHVRIFHFEFLFIAYFLRIFAFIFNRGVDFNNELEQVL